jgi:hypothetical protein
MCGRLRVGKENLHVAGLASAPWQFHPRCGVLASNTSQHQSIGRRRSRLGAQVAAEPCIFSILYVLYRAINSTSDISKPFRSFAMRPCWLAFQIDGKVLVVIQPRESLVQARPKPAIAALGAAFIDGHELDACECMGGISGARVSVIRLAGQRPETGRACRPAGDHHSDRNGSSTLSTAICCAWPRARSIENPDRRPPDLHP